jgi:hypothetical protein
MIGHTSCHRGGNSQRAVYSHEVVVHVMQTDGVRVVLDLLTEGISQSCEPTHAHPHRKVLPFNVACADVVWIRIAGAAERLCPLYLRRTVSAGRVRYFAVHFDQLGVIDIRAEARLDCFQVGVMARR